MEKWIIIGLILYLVNSCWWVLFSIRLSRRIDKALTDLSYLSKIGQLNSSEDAVSTPTMQAKAMRVQADVQAAIKSASRVENIEVHNADNLGDDIIMDE